MMGAGMALMDEAVWRGKKAFTDTRWVTIRGDLTPYPF
jgi:hypothetical protein